MDFTYINSRHNLKNIEIVRRVLEMYDTFKLEESGKSSIGSKQDYLRVRRMDAVYRFVEYVMQAKTFENNTKTWDTMFTEEEQENIINYIVTKFYLTKGTSKIFDYLGYNVGSTDHSLLGLPIIGNCIYNGETVEIRFDESIAQAYPDEVKFSRYLTDFIKCLLFISSNTVDSWEYYGDTVEGRRLDVRENIELTYKASIRVFKIITIRQNES